MDPTIKIPYSDPKNPKYRTLFGKCHVTTATQIMSLLFVGYHLVLQGFLTFLPDANLDVMIIMILLSLLYATPFVAINKVQPWFLIPLLALLIIAVAGCALQLIDCALAFVKLSMPQPSHQFAFNAIFGVLNAVFLYFTIRCFQYLKEIKMLQQKQQKIIHHEIKA